MLYFPFSEVTPVTGNLRNPKQAGLFPGTVLGCGGFVGGNAVRLFLLTAEFADPSRFPAFG